jgi:hypothetical protein
MITQETAAAIWDAYREIDAAEKLLADMAEERSKPGADRDRYAPTLKDAFGRRKHLQLGIPSGNNAHRLFDVHPELAEAVIRAHIGKMKSALVEANERARIELNGAK